MVRAGGGGGGGEGGGRTVGPGAGESRGGGGGGGSGRSWRHARLNLGLLIAGDGEVPREGAAARHHAAERRVAHHRLGAHGGKEHAANRGDVTRRGGERGHSVGTADGVQK